MEWSGVHYPTPTVPSSDSNSRPGFCSSSLSSMAMAARPQLVFRPTKPAPACRRRLSQAPPASWSRRPDHHPRSIAAAAAAAGGGSSSSPSSRRRPQQQQLRSSSTAIRESKQQQQEAVTLKLTYLEINSWVWEVQRQQGERAPVRILVDPLVVGNLDFGAPWLFDGAKRDPRVRALGVDDLLAPGARPDLLLITQSLDDHCHARTLAQLSARAPDLPVVTTPNARPVLASLPTPFRRVTYLEPGQSAAVADADNHQQQQLRVLATAGPVLGPPWQRPENGYILFMAGDGDESEIGPGPGLLYYEPHCVYDRSFLEERRLRADVVVTPVVKQLLPANFTLVSGQEDAVDLARLLRARYVVPMSNGDVDARGILATVLTKQGTTQSFQALLSEALPQAQVLHPTSGVPLQVQLQLDTIDDDGQ